jgi:hypothetical protein
MKWTRLMPAIPLAPGVPVIRPDGTKGIALRPHRNRGPREEGIWITWADSDRHHGCPQTGYNWRNLTVDLDDPQGFGYALRWLVDNADRPHLYRLLATDDSGWQKLCWSHFRGATNEDRVLLARAIAELNN